MKKAKLILKITLIVLFALCSALIVSGIGFYYFSTKSIALDTQKLEETKLSSTLQIFDSSGNQIKPASENYVSIKKLSANTKNAFVCAEDKRFYTHRGLDYIRIGGAILSNLKSRSFSQGASTISQQLVKNTQLSSEKTISRKLKEFKLTKQLEKQYSKNQILEFYLNNIYFGNGAYGIENASLHYFGKSATKLTLAESALLAATINAPSFYDIENKQQNALERRNLILDLMQKYGKISKEELASAKAEPITLNLTKLSNNDYVFDEIIKEASKATNLTETMLKNSNLKIYTQINQNLQTQISKLIKQTSTSLDQSPQIACLVIDNKFNKIISISGSKQLLQSNISPGSAVKPVLVYAPAIEENIISPATKILDEKINISGYTPENADKTYHGYVSVREALSKSLNIPSVKILQELGTDKSQNFAKKLGFTFSENDNNLATALGAISNGVSLKTLADAYSSFANGGKFTPSSLITKITKNDKTIFESKSQNIQVMKDSTAYLITDMLKTTAHSGTAKRLKNLPYDIASKTGTVGIPNSKNNLSAINVSYTTNHTIVCLFAGKNMPENINGGTYPTIITKDICDKLYGKNKPANFKKPNSVKTKAISKTDYSLGKISLTNNPSDSITELFSSTNLPQYKNSFLPTKLEVFNFENQPPILCFFTSPNLTYQIIRKENDKEVLLATIENLDDSKITKFEDKTVKNSQIYEYFVKICEKSSNLTHQTNSVKLKTFD